MNRMASLWVLAPGRCAEYSFHFSQSYHYFQVPGCRGPIFSVPRRHCSPSAVRFRDTITREA